MLLQAIGGIVLALAGLNLLAAVLRPKLVRYRSLITCGFCTAGSLFMHCSALRSITLLHCLFSCKSTWPRSPPTLSLQSLLGHLLFTPIPAPV